MSSTMTAPAEEAAVSNPETTLADQARHEALRAAVHSVKAKRGCAMADLAREAGIAPATFSAWAAGTYAGNVGKFDALVQRWLDTLGCAARKRAELPAAPGFIWTQTAQTIRAAFEHAQHAPDLVQVVGAPGIGKTSAVDAYRQEAPNVWKITGEPCISTPRMILDEVAEQLGVNEGRSTHRISRAIVAKLRGTRGLLVVDEAQWLPTAVLDQLRTLHDLAGVGVALVGNEQLAARIDGGARRPEFAQLFSRVGMRVSRTRAASADIAALLDAWALEGAAERRMMAAIGRRPGGLRNITKVMRNATMQARAADAPVSAQFIEMAWKHLAAQPLEVAA